MKKILTTLSLAVMILFAGCVDLDDIYRRLDEQARELATVKALVNAINEKISVTSYIELSDKSGYELIMSDGSKIVLKHGSQGAKGDKGDKGDQGNQGNDGQDGDANLTITDSGDMIIIVYKGVTYTLPKGKTPPMILLTTTKNVGEIISLSFDAVEADRPDVWIDLNNNGIKDAGEAVTKFGSVAVDYTIISKTISIYGKVGAFDCSHAQLTSLDVSSRAELATLQCSSNQLTSLDVRNNTALEFLYCNDNQLTSLDVRNNSKLEYLECTNNRLTSLDVKNNIKLEVLVCSYNQLTTLDVSKNTELGLFYCNNNQLTSLDLSKNLLLQRLWCYNNQISGSNMNLLVNSLPNRTGKEIGEFRVFAVGSGTEQNIINAAQAATAKGKNWSVQDYDGNPYTP